MKNSYSNEYARQTQPGHSKNSEGENFVSEENEQVLTDDDDPIKEVTAPVTILNSAATPSTHQEDVKREDEILACQNDSEEKSEKGTTTLVKVENADISEIPSEEGSQSDVPLGLDEAIHLIKSESEVDQIIDNTIDDGVIIAENDQNNDVNYWLYQRSRQDLHFISNHFVLLQDVQTSVKKSCKPSEETNSPSAGSLDVEITDDVEHVYKEEKDHSNVRFP
jgi:hypothetical protein